MYLLDLKHDFQPIYGESIYIPPNCLFFRGYDTRFPTISSHPSHFGNYDTAIEYAHQEHRQLGSFTTSKELKVVDLRYLMIVLRDLFRSRSITTNEILDIILSCSLAYGLCSFKKQLHLLNMRYEKRESKAMQKYYNEFLDKDFLGQPTEFDMVEAQGVRIAETINDGIVLSFLSKLFEHENIDGFVAPSFFSPYHVEKPNCKTSPELVIFDPLKSGIIKVEVNERVVPITIANIVNRQFVHKSINYKSFMKTSLRGRGGNKRSKHKSIIIHDFENFFHSLDNDKVFLQKVENAQKAAITLSNTQKGFFVGKPYPSLPVSPWKNLQS
jgi:hypothetical protein